jgi:hypothetical protein
VTNVAPSSRSVADVIQRLDTAIGHGGGHPKPEVLDDRRAQLLEASGGA